jgi:hypothetical protein
MAGARLGLYMLYDTNVATVIALLVELLILEVEITIIDALGDKRIATNNAPDHYYIV